MTLHHPGPIRFGVVGYGHIGKRHAEMIKGHPRCALGAVADTNASLKAHVDEHHGVPFHESVEDLLAAHPDLDVICVCTPNALHAPHSQLALEHRKHVVCEKPMGINSQQTQDMICAAREKNVFLMEALWTWFLPAWKQVRTWLDEGKIGEVRLFHADFSFHGSGDLDSRLYNPALAGGALLDIGIYPIVMAYWVFGRNPVQVASLATLSETKVDAQSSYLFRYDQGEQAILNSSFQVHGPKEAILSGTRGRIRVPLFWRAEEAMLEIDDEVVEHFREPHKATGLEYEAAAAMEDIRQGRLESSVFLQADSLRLVNMFDQLRKEWGVVYPGE